jgi:hypothetical protein
VLQGPSEKIPFLEKTSDQSLQFGDLLCIRRSVGRGVGLRVAGLLWRSGQTAGAVRRHAQGQLIPPSVEELAADAEFQSEGGRSAFGQKAGNRLLFEF